VVAALSLTFLRLPVYFGHEAVLQPAMLAIILLCIAWGAPRQPAGSWLNAGVALALALAVISGIARLRGAEIGAYGSLNSAGAATATYVTMVAFGVLLITTATSNRERRQRIVAVVLAPVIYTISNVAMHLGGLEAQSPTGATERTGATLLDTVGVATNRIKFPLATSVNLFGVIAAAGLAGLLVLHLRSRGSVPRWFVLAGTASGGYALLFTDARASMAIALAVVALLAARRRINGWMVGVLLPLMPLLVIWGLKLVGAGLDTILTRSGSGGAFSTASNRVYIWQGAWDVLGRPDLHWIYGWGAGGQDTSGAALHYNYLFPTVPGPSVQAHSVVIQTILDSGLIGLLALAAASGVACWQLQRKVASEPTAPTVALLAVLLVPIINGATESSPTYWADESLITVLLVMGVAAGLATSPIRRDASSTPNVKLVVGDVSRRPEGALRSRVM
jgi:hypothetical protein